MTDRPFDRGGWVPGPQGDGRVPAALDDAECVISAADVRANRWRCSRRDERHMAAAHESDLERGDTP